MWAQSAWREQSPVPSAARPEWSKMTDFREATEAEMVKQPGSGKKLIRVGPRGFCAGVVRAVDIVELALQAYRPPVYVHHEIVHNRYVVDGLRERGAIFVEPLQHVPAGG